MRSPFRRYKADYRRLFSEPDILFPSVNVTLWPNGSPEIWIKSKDGRQGFRVVAGNGPAGLSVTVSPFMGAKATLVGLTDQGETLARLDAENVYDANLLIYNADDWSQAFKAWVQGKAPYPGPKLTDA